MLEREPKIIQVKESILEDNDADADKLRGELLEEKTFYLNIMSSPGSGKTSSILQLIRRLKDDFRIGVLEADIDGDVDTRTMLNAGVASVQIHTGGMCHLDADMSRQSLKEIGSKDLDLVILENVGNLVCPADFPLGTDVRVVVISTTEGDDMVRKHHDIFIHSDFAVLNKIDIADAVGVDPNIILDDYKKLTGNRKVMIETSARKEIGLAEIIEEMGL
jgi:hydrogenase nickel incorporation protein HypB